MDEPDREVWVVSDKEGPCFVATYRQAAMEHAAESAGEFPELSPWRVCKYVAEPFVREDANACVCLDGDGKPLNQCNECPR